MTNSELKQILKIAKDKQYSSKELNLIKKEYNRCLEIVYTQPNFSIIDDGDDDD